MFDWREFHTIAKFLHENCNKINDITPEAAFRSAIGRAYYAAFNTACQFAKEEFHVDPSRQGKGSHDYYIEMFRYFENENSDYKKIAIDLKRMKEYRNLADYKKNFSKIDPKTSAQLTIKYSENILSTLRNIQNGN